MIYWEQESWGGVDTHLLELLSTWPVVSDQFVLMVNKGNRGFARLRERFELLPNVRCVEVTSYSHNELNRRCRESLFLSPIAKLLHFLQPITYWIAIYCFKFQIKREGRFDILMADNGGYPAAWGSMCAIEAAAQLEVQGRVLLIHHAAVVPAPFMGLFERYVDARMTRLTSAIVCVSKATREVLCKRRYFDEAQIPMRVIYNRITQNSMCTLNEVPNIKAAIEANADKLLIGMVGRVVSYKGHEDVIFALGRLEPHLRNNIRFVIIGAADEPTEIGRLRRKSIRLGVEENVKFLGYVNGQPVDFIRQLDLLIVATRSFEGFGLTLIEAMSVGVPVLATQVGAIPEVVLPELGALVPPNDPAAIADALTDFLKDRHSWSVKAQTALEIMSENRMVMSKEYRSLFVEVLS